jgi:hypothetical protein
MWRSHPVLFAALLGAAAGFANTLFIEFGGLYKKNTDALLLMIWPNAALGSGVNESTFFQAAFVLLIEVAANVFVYALLFAVPVAVIVAIRHALRSRKKLRERRTKGESTLG